MSNKKQALQALAEVMKDHDIELSVIVENDKPILKIKVGAYSLKIGNTEIAEIGDILLILADNAGG